MAKRIKKHKARIVIVSCIKESKMSYDLDFWKYKPGIVMNHQDVYEKLSDGYHVDGLEELPIPQFLKRVKEVFLADGWEQLDELNYESDKGAFQIYTTPQFFRVDCYGMEGEDMNKFLDIASEFGCPLYDPQVGERYVGSYKSVNRTANPPLGNGFAAGYFQRYCLNNNSNKLC